jgi:hypothetical protein
MLAQLKGITPPPAAEGMPNVDVPDNFAHATIHSAQTNTTQGQMTSWLSKAQHGTPKGLSKFNRKTYMDWGDENTAQMPQSLRAQPMGM